MSESNTRTLIVACSLAALLASAARSAESKPFSVWTKIEGVQVYSGPGNEYYATQDLPGGAECEVYEELPGGWLAIRPPAASYSVVSASALEQVDGRIARVVRDNVPSRVGSLLVDDHDAVHVRLEEGEQVLLTQAEMATNSEWMVIAPPAGEFRWIRKVDVSREQPTATSQEETKSAWRERPEQEQNSGTPIAPDATSVSVASHDETIASSSETLSPPGLIQVDGKNSWTPAKRVPTAAPLAAPIVAQGRQSFDQRVDQLEIQLSRRIAGPSNLWVFDDLERDAAQLLSIANTPEQTTTVNELASRMRRFADLREKVAAADDDTRTPPRQINQLPPRAPNLTNYDAAGVLRPVISKRGNAPPYALVDERGEVVTFLTPSPSLDLQQYLGQRVGVSGTRSYLPEYRRRNLQTARIAPLDTARLR